MALGLQSARRMRRSLLAIACASSTAFADPFQPPSSIPEAQDHYVHAKALFADKHYPDAAAEFAKALELDPSATFLVFNVALAQRMAGDCAAAITTYQIFLAAQPPDDQAVAARTG